MDTEQDVVTLAVADYVVFGSMLVVSAAVGIFFAIRDRKQKKTENYLLGNRKISPWASGFSNSLSFLSGASVVGIPAELAYMGATYTWLILSAFLATVIPCEMFLPVFYKLGVSSVYEYYGLRFGKITRYIATAIYILQTVAYTGVMIYAPALVLNAVSDFSLWGAVLSTGLVCILYTTLGGLKAVIWTNVIQGLILAIVLFVVLFMSVAQIGGIDEVFRINSEGDRLDFFHFELDPRYRMTFWGVVFGLGTMWSSIGATNQAVAQRFLCCKSVTDGKKAIYFSWFGSLIFIVLLVFIGWTTYAYFAYCDPILSGKVGAADQVAPYMILNVFRELPGLSGLFIAGLFAAALSTISSALNGMTCVTVEDLIRPNVKWSENTMLWLSKGFVVLYGGLCIAFAYLASALGGVVQASLSLLGVCAGALFGPAVMGTLTSFSNAPGAACGMITALATNIWIFVGATIYPPPAKFIRAKSLSIEGCPVANETYTNVTAIITTSIPNDVTTDLATEANDERPPIAEFYAVSFTYYALIGLTVCLLVGTIVSFATGGWKARHKVDSRYLNYPFDHFLLRRLPEKFRSYMRPMSSDTKVPYSDGELKIEPNGISTVNGGIEVNWKKPNESKDKELGRLNRTYMDDDRNMSTEL